MRVFTELKEISGFRRAVVTIGSFDGVHSGHRGILEKVKALADSCQGESVVVTFDPHPRTVLKPDDANFKLITTTSEKIRLLTDCGIDNVVIVPFTLEFSKQTAAQYVEDFLIRFFHPRYIVIGYDHRFGNNREGDLSFLKKYETFAGFEVVEIAAQEIDEISVSSSKIRLALDRADLTFANRLLGHPFCLSGTVVEGNKIGRTIGFPTANLRLGDPYKLVLPPGVYAAWASVDAVSLGEKPRHNGFRVAPEVDGMAGRRPAMLYIGSRPTVEQEGLQVIEVNLIGFDGDLYGAPLKVEVLDFIRPDKKLAGLSALKGQIEVDKGEILKRLNVGAQMENVKNEETTPSLGIQETKSGDRIAIVILNYNTRKHLETFLPSVIANSPGARVIVADNGSPDDSVVWLKNNHPGVELIDLHKNHGFAQGYNEALRQVVDADIYVVLNSDVEVTPGWMAPIATAMRQDRSIGVAQPKILAWRDKVNTEKGQAAAVRFEYAGAAGGWIDFLGYPFCRGRIFSHSEPDFGQYDDPQPCFWAAGAAFFIRADLYHAFGGFDGDYFAHNEEIDLCWRLKRAGYSVWCFPQSVVYHLGGGTLEYENPRKVFLNFRNSLYSLLKNESAGKLCWLMPARFLLDGLAALRFAAKGQFRAIWAIVQAHGSFYRHFRSTLEKRKKMVQIIEDQRIAPKNTAGIYPKSIIVSHYLRRIKIFSKLRLP